MELTTFWKMTEYRKYAARWELYMHSSLVASRVHHILETTQLNNKERGSVNCHRTL
jgi:hypothetical protein